MATFIDTNIPIYSGGGPHPLREACADVVRLVADRATEFITDAEVLQEILHVYKARRQWPDGRVVFDAFFFLMSGRIAPILAADVETASQLADGLDSLSARDLIHLAVMNRLAVTRIVTADTAFDGVPGIERLDPARLAEWRDRI